MPSPEWEMGALFRTIAGLRRCASRAEASRIASSFLPHGSLPSFQIPGNGPVSC